MLSISIIVVFRGSRDDVSWIGIDVRTDFMSASLPVVDNHLLLHIESFC